VSRNAFVPMSWITSDLNGEALRTLILISTYADGKTGECWPTNTAIGRALGKSSRAVQLALNELKDAGFISMVDGQGKNRKIKVESKDWFDRPTKKTSNHEGNLHGSTMKKTFTVDVFNHEGNLHPNHEGNLHPNHEGNLHPNHEGNLHPNHEGNLHPPNKNTPIEHTQEHNSSGGGVSEESESHATATAAVDKNLEPFEAGLGTRLPDVRNGVKPFRQSQFKIVPTQFEQSTIDRIYQVLGTDGDAFAAMVTQDQADAGFVEWILRKAETGKKPIALAIKLLKTSWRDGWTNPNAEEDAQYAELVEMMRSIQQ
jgi:hypothetical protein